MDWGEKKVPTNRLPSLIEDVKTIYGKFGDSEIDHETISRLLNHSSHRSGAYLQKIADMRTFGLIEKRGQIKVTEIGRKVSYPNNPYEEQEGLKQTIKGIEFWKLIYEKYMEKGLKLPPDFWSDIRVWTGLPPEKAKAATEKIKKAYLEDIKYIKPEGIKPERVKMEKVEEIPAEVSSLELPAQLTSADFGTIKIRNIETINLARQLLTILENKFKTEEKKEKSKD